MATVGIEGVLVAVVVIAVVRPLAVFLSTAKSVLSTFEVVRLGSETFDVETILTRVNREDNRGRFEAFDVEMFEGSQLELWALDHHADQSTPDWLTALTRSGGVETITVSDGDAETVAEVDRSLPERAFVTTLTRKGETRVPEGSDRVERGDRLTVIGRADAVEETIARLSDRSDERT